MPLEIRSFTATSRFYSYRSMAVVAAALLLVAIQVGATSSGVSGKSTVASGGCGVGCHGFSSNGATTAFIEQAVGGALTFNAGEKRMITLVVRNANRPYAGFNVSVKTTSGFPVNMGTFSAVNSDSRASGGEMVHNQPKQLTSGEVKFEFYWTAPPTPGTYRMYGAVNAVNRNGTADGNDQWNFMPTIDITVNPATSVREKQPSANLKISPMPAHEAVTVEAPVFGEMASVTVFNVQGTPVRSFEVACFGGVSKFDWDGRDSAGNQVPDGLYFLNIEDAQAVLRGIVLFERK